MRLTALSSTTSTGTSAAGAGVGSGSGSGASATTARSAVNQNVLPRPGSPWAPISPPISSTSSRQMLSPRPVPPCVRVVDESACENGSNSRSACAASMPIPVSVTSKRTRRPRSVGSPSVTRTVISPGSGELDRVGDEVGEHLLEAEAVADDLQPRAALDERAQLEPLAAGVLGQQLDGVVDRVGEVELGVLELDLAGLDLRQVEDVVDDRQQGVGRGAHHRGVALLLLGQLACRAAARPSRSRRSSGCAARGSCWRGTATSSRSPRAPRRARAASSSTVAAALDEEADRQPDGGQQLAQLARRARRARGSRTRSRRGSPRRCGSAGRRRRTAPRRDRDRAIGDRARHQRLGPHRIAGVGHAHGQVLERERRRRPPAAARPRTSGGASSRRGAARRSRRRPATACRPPSRGCRRAPRAAAAPPARRSPPGRARA